MRMNAHSHLPPHVLGGVRAVNPPGDEEMDTGPARRGGKAELRCTQVLDAARACFRAHGFQGASMAQIAATAGMSVGQIYRYFANKDAVIAAIIEQGVHENIEHISTIEALVRSGGDLAQVSAEAGSEHVAASKHPDDLALMLEIFAEAARNPTIARMVQEADARLRERAEAMITAARPGWSPDRVTAAVATIAILHEGLYLRGVADPAGFGPAGRTLFQSLIAHALTA